MTQTDYKSEPDTLDWEAHGLPCRMRRNRTGAWCGYVGLSATHPLHGKKYSTPVPELEETWKARQEQQVPRGELGLGLMIAAITDKTGPTMECALAVHGGVTFADLPWWPETAAPDCWWIGFDCSHAGDLTPKHPVLVAPATLLQGMVPRECGVYRTLTYARTETERLAAQLSALDPSLIKD